MPHILDVQFPEVQPTGAPTGDFLRVPSSPEAFGGFGAQAQRQFGQGIERVGEAGLDVLNETNRLQDQIHASELHSDFSDKAGDLISNFTELRGRAALDGLPGLKQQIEQLQTDAEGSAPNLYTKALVAGNTRNTMDRLLGWATKHADAQRTAWATTTAQNNITAATNMGGLAISQQDFSSLDRQMNVIGAEAHNYYDPQGYDPQTLAVQVSKYKGEAVKNWVETAATNLKDPDAIPHALQIFERYSKDIDPGSRLVINKYIRAAATNLTTDRLATHFTSAPGRTEDESLSPLKRALLDTIAGSEVGSEGGYDTLYTGKSVEKIKPNFDYVDHPRIMFPAQYGPTSAFGRYQITATTWDNDKNRFGLTDITPVSQDEWASKKTDELYAKRYQSGAFRAFTGLTGNLDTDLAAHAGDPRFVAAVGHALSGEWTSLPGGLQPNAATASFVQRFAKNAAINRGESAPIPDAQDVVDRINADPALATRPDLRDQVTRKALARIGQQQRAYNLSMKAVKDQSDAEELQIFANIHSDKPTITTDQILNNPLLTNQAKMRMTEQLEKATGADRAEKNYGAGFYDLYRRIHLPENDPQRLTDPGELYGHVGKGGDLTVAGVDKLVAEIQGRKTPEGVAESEMKAQFLKNARAQITGTDEGLHIRDPKGDELYLKFLAQVLPAYDAARKQGKSAAALLNPDSPDYLGKAIAGFRRPMDQWFNDTIHDHPSEGGTTGRFDIGQVKSLDDLVAAYRRGDVTKQVADELAIANGWAVRKPPQPALPEVPMSR